MTVARGAQSLTDELLSKIETDVRLGEGSSCYVYRGHMNGIGAVAVKRFVHVEDSRAQLQHEATMLQRFNHPNIPRLYGVCRERSALVMELLGGGSVQRKLAQDAAGLLWGRRIKILHDVALALSYMHGHGVVHRDIKPGNVLLGEELESAAKLADMGLSRTIGSDSTQSLDGTAEYADPDYLANRVFKPAHDIYSFGVMMLDVLCG